VFGTVGWTWVPCLHLQRMFAFKSNVVGWYVFCNRDLVVVCVTRVVQGRQGSSSRSCGSRGVLPPQDPDLVRTHGNVPRSHLCAPVPLSLAHTHPVPIADRCVYAGSGAVSCGMRSWTSAMQRASFSAWCVTGEGGTCRQCCQSWSHICSRTAVVGVVVAITVVALREASLLFLQSRVLVCRCVVALREASYAVCGRRPGRLGS
jgi:hypothetical protein